jgi:outer membrane protein OmpU
MKKILLATTVLALTAGVASAEVAVSGSARMGVINDGTDSFFSSRVRIVFAGSGTTDGGLSFGAETRADQESGNDAANGSGETSNGDSTVFVSGSFGTLTMGDVAGGAADKQVGHVSGVGYTNLGDINEIDFLGGDATAARYDYTSGALSVSVGIGQISGSNDAASVAVKYAPGAYSVALGYSTIDAATGDTQVDLLGSATFGAATVKARVADRADADTATAVSLDYVFGATTLTGFAMQNVGDGFAIADFAANAVDVYGVGVAYDLGGGAAIKAGAADNGTDTIYDAGITLSF